MAISERRFRVDHVGECQADIVDRVFAGSHAALFRLKRVDFRDQIAIAQPLPQGAALGHRDGGADELRIEPAAASALRRVDSRTAASDREINVESLSKIRDTREDGDFPAAQSEGISLAVPMLV